MPPQTQIAHRIYYDEQDRLEFTAEVTEIRELARVEGQPIFQIALDRTAFYPTSGGQPSDTGALLATARSGAVLEAPVLDVTEDANGEVWHTTRKPLQPGTEVRATINAARRRDHMQQHSGQHLLSAMAAREFGWATVGFHLGEKVSTVDLTTGTLSDEQAQHLERLANEAIAAALPIAQRSVSGEQARQMLAEGVLRKLPDRPGDIRLVVIAGIDHNACGGTHVASTAQIGPILLRKLERVRGNTRVSFLCGARALAAARQDWGMLTVIASSLSTSVHQVGERVQKLQDEIKAARKQLQQQAAKLRSDESASTRA